MARTLEVLDARGLADDVLAHAHKASGVSIFAGARIDLTHLRSAYQFVAVTPQTNVDRALAEYAEMQGADVRRGFEVVALEQDSEGVTVTARPKDDDDPQHTRTWRAAYVVGADGAHSTVRDLLGAEFPGRTILSSVVLADVKLADGPTSGELTLGSTRDVIGFLAPYDRGDEDGAWYRAMVWDRKHQVPDSEPASPDEVIDVLTRAMGRDVGVLEIGWLSRFHCDERQVAQYRYGRVFLAGDAAHVHSPMGGQGMNTGIQDAANLAWKLDAVLGGAPDDVLDTYQSERHPIGKQGPPSIGDDGPRGHVASANRPRHAKPARSKAASTCHGYAMRLRAASRVPNCATPIGAASTHSSARGRRRFRSARAG